jgi:hypothetical protein
MNLGGHSFYDLSSIIPISIENIFYSVLESVFHTDRNLKKERKIRKMDGNIKITIDSSELDETIEKANRLKEILLEIQNLIHSLGNKN